MANSNETLAKNILKTVVYFDLFEYPLTAEQLFTFLPQNSVSVDDVKRTAEALVSKNELQKADKYFFLPFRMKEIVVRRSREERQAERMMRFARLASHIIKRFPFVRAIFLTGSLSKNVVDPSGDIDFMIVTAPNRVWICRTMLTAFRKIFLFGSKKYFCTNYYVTTNSFAHPRRNLYAAIEVVTTKAVWNESAFDEFQSSNRWTKKFLPNSRVEPDKRLLLSPSRSFFQRVSESILKIFPLDALDARLMEMHRTHWQSQFNDVNTEKFNSMFIISPDVSAGWPEDRQGPVMEQFHRKVSSLGIG